MTKIITRRQLLSTAAATAATGAIGVSVLSSGLANAAILPASSGAQTYWTKQKIERYLCAQIHQHKAQELTRIQNSPNLDAAEKNLAMRTAHCAKCGTHIQPTDSAGAMAVFA